MNFISWPIDWRPKWVTACLPVCLLIDRLTDMLVCQLTNQLTDWSTKRWMNVSTEWQLYWLTDQLSNWQTSQRFNWQTHQTNDRQMVRYTNQPTNQRTLTVRPTYYLLRNTGSLIHAIYCHTQMFNFTLIASITDLLIPTHQFIFLSYLLILKLLFSADKASSINLSKKIHDHTNEEKSLDKAESQGVVSILFHFQFPI